MFPSKSGLSIVLPSKRGRCYCITKQTWQMLKIGKQMMKVPDLSDFPILMRRYIEAAILKNVFDEI